MKFRFQNLGTIKKTTLDLRPLTVIVGPNNTNKTYLAYCVHGLINSIRGARNHDLFLAGKAEVSVDLPRVVARAQAVTDAATGAFTRQLAEYFQDTYGGLFKRTALGVHIEKRDIQAGLRRCTPEAFGGLKLVGNTITVSAHSSSSATKRMVFRTLVDDILAPLTRSPLILPAERNAFIITYKMLSTRRYRVLRDRERQLVFHWSPETGRGARDRQVALLREQGDIRYPAPIEEFLDFLTDVELNAARPKNEAKSRFGKLASQIESHIQAGHRTGYEPTKLGGSELALTVSDRLRVDLYNASSSIKQLAPLLLYLRYRAEPNQTLIIDEPEMNLHPEGQAKLLEALGMLANLGVHVLLTTHSPYFMAHLNNLIASDQTSAARQKRQARHLYMGDSAAFLSPDDVSAYEMRAEGLASLADPEYGIRWDTLSDVSAELQRRYFAIVEEPKGRGKAKGK